MTREEINDLLNAVGIRESLTDRKCAAALSQLLYVVDAVNESQDESYTQERRGVAWQKAVKLAGEMKR